VPGDWLARYRQDGFVRIRAVFPRAEIDDLSRYFDEILVRGSGLRQTTKEGLVEFRVVPIAGRPTLKFAKWASAAHEGLTRIRTSPRLLSIVQGLLGPDVVQITNQMHWKNPGDEVSFQMHQDCTFRKPDASYRNLHESFVQTGIAVDAATADNGCLQFVPGSHLERRALLAGGYEGAAADVVNAAVLRRFPPPVDLVMDPGDVVVWSPYVIHGSQPNRSTQSRRLYINGFGRAADCDHGARITVGGRVVPLRWGPETRWDVVEER